MTNNVLVKSLLYRIYSIGIAFLFFWLLLGEMMTATWYTAILESIKVLQYFCFEVVWQRFSRPKANAL